jgi:hypothetical protein
MNRNDLLRKVINYENQSVKVVDAKPTSYIQASNVHGISRPLQLSNIGWLVYGV